MPVRTVENQTEAVAAHLTEVVAMSTSGILREVARVIESTKRLTEEPFLEDLDILVDANHAIVTHLARLRHHERTAFLLVASTQKGKSGHEIIDPKHLRQETKAIAHGVGWRKR